MSDSLQWTIRNSLPEVSRLVAEVHQRLQALKIAPDAAYNVEFAIEEMLSNTVKFAYADQAAHEIAAALTVTAEEIALRLTDDGHEFNPLTAAEPDTNLPLEERPIGGLGIHLVRKMAGKTDYRREGGKNILTLVYPLAGDA